MPRQARPKSKSGIYHIIMRGINRQIIFEDDEDREKFLEEWDAGTGFSSQSKRKVLTTLPPYVAKNGTANLSPRQTVRKRLKLKNLNP